MNKKSLLFSLVAVLAIGVIDVAAQGRGNDRGRDRESSDRRGNANGHYKRRDKDDRRDHDRDRRDYDRDHNHYASRSVHHHHDRYCDHRPVVVHHYHSSRPRYVYYRDYDVYYDYVNRVYITFAGRGWTVSTGVPIAMRHVDLRRAKRYEIDYRDDDFAGYLDRRGRPQYGRECDW